MVVQDLNSKKRINCYADGDLLVYTAASRETSAFKRFQRSAKINGIHPKVLGMDLVWNGLTEKAALLKRELEQYRNDYKKIVLFTDAYDVVYNGGADQILTKFKQLNTKVLFSAEKNCWPDKHFGPL